MTFAVLDHDCKLAGFYHWHNESNYIWTELKMNVSNALTDLVNIKREGSIPLDAVLPSYRSCLVHTVDRFHSKDMFSCD